MVRFKWALTEDRPVIKVYDEKGWAVLPDARSSIAGSLDLLDVLHRRWAVLLRSLTWVQLQREFVHPESGPVALAVNIGAYACDTIWCTSSELIEREDLDQWTGSRPRGPADGRAAGSSR